LNLDETIFDWPRLGTLETPRRPAEREHVSIQQGELNVNDSNWHRRAALRRALYRSIVGGLVLAATAPSLAEETKPAAPHA
jgi:hypothetical protein